MKVKVSVGKTFNALDKQHKDDTNRIELLERNMIEKDIEVTTLKAEISNLKGLIKQMNDDYNALSKTKEMLREEVKTLTTQKDKMSDNMISSSQSNKDLIESNKKLQLEIERLNTIISSKDKAESKNNEEYSQMTKIKNGFEDKIISLSSKTEELSAKILSYEQMIKQKDKYIQMLLNNKKSASSGRLQHFTKPSYHKDLPSNTNQTDPNIVNNIILLKNKLTEKESVIYHLNEELKSLKKDNSNLITRLKNTNATATAHSALMKKAI